jgi:hypothetical protein
MDEGWATFAAWIWGAELGKTRKRGRRVESTHHDHHPDTHANHCPQHTQPSHIVVCWCQAGLSAFGPRPPHSADVARPTPPRPPWPSSPSPWLSPSPVAKATNRAIVNAKNNLVFVDFKDGRGIYEPLIGKKNSTIAMIYPRPPEAGHRVGPIMRAVCECFGLMDVTGRVVGNNNPYTVIQVRSGWVAVWLGGWVAV